MDELTCLGNHQMWGGPLVLQVLNMDTIWTMGYRFWGSPISCEGSLSRFKVQRNFFLLCSSTNFVGYSCHDDPMLYSTKLFGEFGYPSNSEDLAFLFAYSDPSSKKIHHPHLLNCPQYECSFLRLSQRYVKNILVSTCNLSPSLQTKQQNII